MDKFLTTIIMEDVPDPEDAPYFHSGGGGDSELEEASVPPKDLSYLAPFFDVVGDRATCILCDKNYIIQPNSNSNLVTHFRRKHPAHLLELQAACKNGSRRGRSSSRRFGQQIFSQGTAQELYYKVFIKHKLPAALTESPELRSFLNYLNPTFEVPSRRTLSRHISSIGLKINSTSNTKIDVSDIATSEDLHVSISDIGESSNPRDFIPSSAAGNWSTTQK